MPAVPLSRSSAEPPFRPTRLPPHCPEDTRPQPDRPPPMLRAWRTGIGAVSATLYVRSRAASASPKRPTCIPIRCMAARCRRQRRRSSCWRRSRTRPPRIVPPPPAKTIGGSRESGELPSIRLEQKRIMELTTGVVRPLDSLLELANTHQAFVELRPIAATQPPAKTACLRRHEIEHACIAAPSAAIVEKKVERLPRNDLLGSRRRGAAPGHVGRVQLGVARVRPVARRLRSQHEAWQRHRGADGAGEQLIHRRTDLDVRRRPLDREAGKQIHCGVVAVRAIGRGGDSRAHEKCSPSLRAEPTARASWQTRSRSDRPLRPNAACSPRCP